MKNIKTAFILLIGAFILSFSGCTGIGDLETVLDTASLENDKTPPVLTVTSHTNGQEVGGVYSFSGLVTDEGSGVSKVFVSVDGGAYGEVTLNSASWTSSISLSLCGPHTNSVYAIDRAGNRSETVSVLVTRDTIPAITISGVADYNAYNTWTFNVGGSVSIDAPYTIVETALSINGGDYTNVGNNAWTKNGVTLTPNATNTLQARAIGSNGKTNFTALVHVIVDCENPDISSTVPMYTNRDSYSLPVNADGGLSGMASLAYRLNGGSLNLASGTNIDLSGLTNGLNTITITGQDNAGNSTNIVLSNTVDTIGIYVGTNGNDTNCGYTPSSPMKTIQLAISNALSFGLSVVCVAQGTYTPGAGLNTSNSGIFITNNSIQLLGGYSADYTSRNGLSTLDGTNGVYHVIYASAPSIKIDGFNIIRGNANSSNTDGCGGGMIFGSTMGLITNCLIYSNNATTGGGLYLLNGFMANIQGVYYNNKATNGGAIYINGIGNTINALVSNNTAYSNGGGIYANSSGMSSVINGTIAYNRAYNGGGMLINAPSTSINASINNNYATVNGGGIDLENLAMSANINGDIVSNFAGNVGGGIEANTCMHTTINGNICSNTAGWGGGIYLDRAIYSTINANVSYNNCTTSGGGIFVNCVFGGASITGIFCNNNSPNGGSAVYIWASLSTTLFDAIMTNNAAVNGIVTIVSGTLNHINNCLIGGQNTSGYGIYEYYVDSTSHTLTGNIFVTNSLGYLYYDFTRGNIGITEINKLNSTNVGGINWTGASVATNNIATNM